MILLKIFSLVYFQCLCLPELLAFAYLLILSGLKVKNHFKKNLKINILIIKITRAITKCTIYFIHVIMRINLIYYKYKIMSVRSLKIKNESIFYSNDMIQLNNFDSRLLKINK